MSASLIGHPGSSAFRLSTNSVSTPLAGLCFSSESAPRPFHHGIRRRGGTIFGAALPLDQREVQADIRSHLIRRPARDIIHRSVEPSFLLSHLIAHRSHGALHVAMIVLLTRENLPDAIGLAQLLCAYRRRALANGCALDAVTFRLAFHHD